MGYMFRLYRVILGPQRLQIQLLQGSQVHCGIPNAYILLRYYYVSIGDPTMHLTTL